MFSHTILLLFIFNIMYFPTIISGIDLKKEYNHSAYMDPSEKYQLHWSVIRHNKTIKFAVQVDLTTGWIGFGISKGLTGKMKYADLVIGWFSGGKGYLKDMHGIGNQRPVIDKQKDYELTEALQVDGQTILKFRRKWLTCDSNDQGIPDGTVKVMYAYNLAQTPTEGDISTIKYHGDRNNQYRGSKSINLKAYVSNVPRPAGLKYFDVLNKKNLVPKDHTTYWCTPYKVPDYIDSKNHIVEVAPIVQKGNGALVHHIVVYECVSTFNESHLNTSGPCEHKAMPMQIKQCRGRNSVYAWAIGGSNFRLPDHVGLPIGVKGNSIKYVVMETHYDNPGLKSGQIDSSGLRFYYTNKTRKYDGATIFSGAFVGKQSLIPPGQDNFIQPNFCSSEMTKTLTTSMPDNSIRIFASFPHAHLAGTGIWTKHVRNGTELPEVIRDDTYDFNYQQTYMLPSEVTFLPGDSMNNYCRYKTTNRQYATTGGESTNEEMCLNFFLYYPRTQIAQCASYPIDVLDFTRKYAKISKGGSIRGADWDGVAWNQTMVDELHHILKTSKLREYVLFQDSSRNFMKVVDRPVIKYPLAISDPCQSKPTSSATASDPSQSKPTSSATASNPSQSKPTSSATTSDPSQSKPTSSATAVFLSFSALFISVSWQFI